MIIGYGTWIYQVRGYKLSITIRTESKIARCGD